MRILGSANESSDDVPGLVETPKSSRSHLSSACFARAALKLRLSQKGDQLRLTGFFQVLTYVTSGENRRIQQLIVNTPHARPRHDPDRRVLLSTLRAPGNAGSPASPPPRSRPWAGTLLLAAGLAALPS
jgi:hypothetical protein